MSSRLGTAAPDHHEGIPQEDSQNLPGSDSESGGRGVYARAEGSDNHARTG